MRQYLLLILLLIFTLNLQAQKDSISIVPNLKNTSFSENGNINISIYPVPVKEDQFTVKTDRDISFIRITNIIGQDILRTKYNTPQQLIRITLDNPKRGMYLVTIFFIDGSRVVKKIMIEESD